MALSSDAELLEALNASQARQAKLRLYLSREEAAASQDYMNEIPPLVPAVLVPSVGTFSKATPVPEWPQFEPKRELQDSGLSLSRSSSSSNSYVSMAYGFPFY